MYISSDGTKKNPAELNYEYLVNAFAKCAREIFNSNGMVDFEKYANNLQVLEKEINERIGNFVSEKMEDEEWLKSKN